MNQISKLFDNIGTAVTSLGAVIFVMLMTITGMVFFSHTLFLQVFPGMELWEKQLATWVMAMAWEATVLITTCNTKHIHKRIPLVMALASGVIVLFFIQAFDDSLTGLQIVQRWFVGIIVATINYIYADLFYAKWQERTSTLAMPRMVDDLQAKVRQLQAAVADSGAALKQAQAELAQARPLVQELRALKDKELKDRTCQWCEQVLENQRSLNSHKGHCRKKPVE